MEKSGKQLSILSLAILENFVEKHLGKKFIEELRLPTDRELKIQSALEHVEDRFQKEFEDKDLSHAIFVDLPADKAKLGEAIGKFFTRPTDSDFPKILAQLLISEFRNLSSLRIDAAISFYVKILKQELAIADESFREKIKVLTDLETLEYIKNVEGKRKFQEDRKTSNVQLIIDGELVEFGEEKKDDLVGVLAALLRVEKESIKILRVTSGSIVLELEMDRIAANRLIKLFNQNDVRLKSAKITSVKIISPLPVSGFAGPEGEFEKLKYSKPQEGKGKKTNSTNIIRNTSGSNIVIGNSNVINVEATDRIAGSVTDSAIIHGQTIVLAERFWRDLKPALPAETINQATAAYLSYLADRHYYLNMKGMGVADRIPLKLKLLDLYVPLKARMELPEGDTWKRDLSLAGRDITDHEQEVLHFGDPVPLIAVLKSHAGMVVLGDPGAGKTTFVKYLAIKLARGEGAEIGLDNYLPILLPLAGYANALQSRDIALDDFIAEYFEGIGANLPVSDMLTEALKVGRALILLDGLDEVRDLNIRNTVVERVLDFYSFHHRQGNKFVITSRVVGYRAVRPSAEDLAECTIVDFEDDEIEEFINHWTSALEKQAQGNTSIAYSDAETERRELIDAIHQNPGVRQLASTPLLLTILALMKRQGVTLPERRVQLYDQYVNTLLSTWNRARSLSGRAPGRDIDEIQTVRILAPLALWMHEVSPGVGLVGREDMRRKLEELFHERGDVSPHQAARQFLQDVREHAALLLERGPAEYGFIHLTFEEYLAAVALALKGQGDSKPIIETLSAHVGEQAWREVTLLTIGYLGIRQQLPKIAGEVVEALVKEKPGPAGEAVVLAGDAVLDTWPGGVPLPSREKVIQALIETMQDASIRSELRRHAGLLLGRLGWRPGDLDRFVEVAEGVYQVGVKKEAKEIPYSYFIAKYPVTNIQFARFVKEDGYKIKEYWSEVGWEWRTGKYDARTLQDVERDWLEHRPIAKRNMPHYWHNIELSNPIVPVVGVCWFEAEAYCNWLSKKIVAIPEGYEIRLPRDEEWERAARGVDGREYPWGDGFNKTAANTWDSDATGSGLGGTTAVCTFPQGASPEDAWDMSGNAWEWTRSWYDDEKKYRIVRGGSWIGYHWFARASFCNWSIPLMFNDDLGFRVVIAPKDKKSNQ